MMTPWYPVGTRKVFPTRMTNPDGKKNKQHNIIWFNPPFSKNVSTNIGCTFLKLVDEHFSKKSTLNRIFNRNTLKVSYSCMPNVARFIKAHNKQTLEKDNKTTNKLATAETRTSALSKESDWRPTSFTTLKSQAWTRECPTLASRTPLHVHVQHPSPIFPTQKVPNQHGAI